VTIQSAAVSVGTTATALNAAESAGSDRVSLVVYNNGASTIYAPYSSYALRQSGTSTNGALPASAPTFDDVRATAPRVLLRVA